jgi:hypothetical protein
MNSNTIFLGAYIAAALWSSSDDMLMDETYNAGDLSGELMAQMIDDCAAFLARRGDLLRDEDLVYAGHDFWLTRNGHGAGFWSRPEVYGEEEAQALTAIAESFGPVDLYVGDDGRIYG